MSKVNTEHIVRLVLEVDLYKRQTIPIITVIKFTEKCFFANDNCTVRQAMPRSNYNPHFENMHFATGSFKMKNFPKVQFPIF